MIDLKVTFEWTKILLLRFLGFIHVAALVLIMWASWNLSLGEILGVNISLVEAFSLYVFITVVRLLWATVSVSGNKEPAQGFPNQAFPNKEGW